MTKQTQLDAYESTQEKRETHERNALIFMREKGAVISYEVGKFLNVSNNLASARICKLQDKGVVRDSGRTRKNPETGRDQIVWVPCDIAPPVKISLTQALHAARKVIELSRCHSNTDLFKTHECKFCDAKREFYDKYGKG